MSVRHFGYGALGVGGLYALYRAALHLAGTDGAAGGFVTIAFAVPVTAAAGVVGYRLETGDWGPRPVLPREPPGSATLGRYPRKTVVTVLSVAWLAAWMFTALLVEIATAQLHDVAIPGEAISEAAADRLSAAFNGVFAAGSLFPLLGTAAVVAGYASAETLGFGSCVLPAMALVTTTFTLQFGSQVITLGIPPSAAVFDMIARDRAGRFSPGDLALMWGATFALFVVIVVMFASFALVCSTLGRWARRFF